MLIGMGSTWGEACGIATYSEQLVASLLADGNHVVALVPRQAGREPFSPERPPRVPLVPSWDCTAENNSDGLCYAVRQHNVDMVHLQHEFGLWAHSGAFIDLVHALRRHVPVVVTLHTVFPPGDKWSGFYGDVLRAADAVVVHNLESEMCLRATARGEGIGGLIARFPHGTPTLPPGDAKRGRELLHLPDRHKESKIGLVLGFVGQGKNVLGTVYAYAAARDAGMIDESCVLVVAGSPQQHEYGMMVVPSQIEMTGYGRDVIYRPVYIPDDRVQDLLAMCSFGILNTTSNNLSASGQVHLFASNGIPLLVADKPIYSDAARAGCPAFHVDDRMVETPTRGFVAMLAVMYRSANVRRLVGERMLALGQATRWTSLAKKYVALYKSLIEKRAGA